MTYTKIDLEKDSLKSQNLRGKPRDANIPGRGLNSRGTKKGQTQWDIFEDFRRFLQVLAFLGIAAFRRHRFSQKTAEDRRISQKPICPIWFVPFGSSLSMMQALRPARTNIRDHFGVTSFKSPWLCCLYMCTKVTLFASKKARVRKVHANRRAQMWFVNFLVKQPCFRLDSRERFWA